MVNRDTCGQVIAVLSEKIHSSHDIEELEALAVRSVVLFAREIGIVDTQARSFDKDRANT